ncbi:DUF3857 and transglutaminase domain-containing protein [Muricauda sp. 334s03]|uniref:DUF3857 and transglutaminase domain-containing protein n=1 Tax=Flagellimonas yonaguniensis TaxID=3031325 RepID=A0ABT5XWZ3_9FLAO|nr:DUF3857 and transglutaminase domain-containing protein [[Muricauda] yonaguniensis]MDF0715675.1 DUF3857 and transglutaminase domain-containing protein [[Muricauda] yonaguniensis]
MRFYFLFLFSLFFHFSFSQNYTVDAIPKEVRQNADAVVRLDIMDVVVEDQDRMKVSAKRVVTIFNEKGNEHVHAYAFYEKNDRVSELEAIIYNAHGKEIKKIKKRDFLDQSAIDGGTLYSDSRVLVMRYTPTQYPYTVEFVKEYTTPNTAFAPNWAFLDDYRVSTEKSEFSFTMECGIPFRHKEENFESYQIDIKETENSIAYKAKNLKAIKAEPLSPSFNDFAPQVKIAMDEFHLEGVDGKASTWQELGKWMNDELLEGRDDLDEGTIQYVKNLVKGVSDPLEKTRIIYKYVQENTRYISVQLGIGGWMPISASDVDRVKYGDCKGLTNYTKALLSAVGVESYYTVVHAGGQMKSFDEDFPSMQGNHVFLNVPLEKEEVWLECTSQKTPVNYLGTFTDNRNVLKVTPKGGELVRTKAYLDEDNYQSTKAEFHVTEGKNVKGKVKILSKGFQYDDKYWRTGNTKSEQEEFYKSYWNYVQNLRLDEVKYQNDANNIEFIEEVAFSVENYLTIAGDKLLLVPNVSNRNYGVPDRSRNRKRPLVIKRGYLDEDEFIIHLPEGYIPETWMLPVKEETKFGVYAISIEPVEPGIIVYKRKLLIKSGEYPKEDYKLYRDFRKKVARYDNSKIVLSKKES